MRQMKVAVLFSGGKDSTYTVWVLHHLGWEISSLITVKPSTVDSWMFHYPDLEWTPLQADAMGFPHRMIQARGDDELVELQDVLVAMKRDLGIVGLATGAIASDYQKVRFDNMCDAIRLRSFSPLWHKRPELLVDDLAKAGFRIVITAVAAKGLDETWLGRELSDEDWKRLSGLSKIHGIHLTGEGGEYESFVLDAPFFKKAVQVEESKVEWNGQSGRLVIERASSRDKVDNRRLNS